MTEKEMMIEKLKTTWTTIGGLTLDEKVFIEKNIRSCVEVDIYGRTDEAELPLRIGALVRLKDDFQLPEPVRYYFCNRDITTHERGAGCWVESDCCVEIPESDLEYVREQIERHEKGEIDLSKWKYQVPKIGELVISAVDGSEQTVTSSWKPDVLRFVRREQAKKSGDLFEENKRLREYISDHVHSFIDSDEIEKILSYEDWCSQEA